MLPQFAFWRAFFISVIVSDSSPSCYCYYCCYRKESISLLILSLVAGAQELLVLLLPLTMTNSKPCLDDKDIFALVVNLVVFVCVYRKSILLTHIFVTIYFVVKQHTHHMNECSVYQGTSQWCRLFHCFLLAILPILAVVQPL